MRSLTKLAALFCIPCLVVPAVMIVDYAYGYDEKAVCTVIYYDRGYPNHGDPGTLFVRTDDGRELQFSRTPALQPGDRCTITWRHGRLGEFKGLPTVTFRRLPTAAETDS